MKVTDTQPQLVSHLKVDVTFNDLVKKIRTSANRPQILQLGQKTLEKAKDIWTPKAAYRWLEFQSSGSDSLGSVTQKSESLANFDFGYSIRFLTQARKVLIAVYTAGHELEVASRSASSKGDLLEAYFLDLIGLIVLEKTADFIKEIVQKKAREFDWGVSPFLSPGSVHGWELEEQIKLCSLLPIEKINVKFIKDEAVLSPFKTVSCLIGLGPGYEACQVGTTCQVCSKKHDCQMKQI